MFKGTWEQWCRAFLGSRVCFEGAVSGAVSVQSWGTTCGGLCFTEWRAEKPAEAIPWHNSEQPSRRLFWSVFICPSYKVLKKKSKTSEAEIICPGFSLRETGHAGKGSLGRGTGVWRAHRSRQGNSVPAREPVSPSGSVKTYCKHRGFLEWFPSSW